MRRAFVIVPAFKEPDMGPVLDSFAREQVPDGWDVTYQCWVTPATINAQDDPTFQIARQHDTFEAVEAPTGFVSTLNASHNAAAKAKADVIIKRDADAPSMVGDVMTEFLTPFDHDESVVCVNSRPIIPPWRWLYAPIQNTLSFALRTVAPYLHGQGYAISRRGWECAGPYNEDLDQTRATTVWNEVEFAMYRRLMSCGRVIDSNSAVVVNDERRHRCRMERALESVGSGTASEWCRSRGEDTFEVNRAG